MDADDSATDVTTINPGSLLATSQFLKKRKQVAPETSSSGAIGKQPSSADSAVGDEDDDDGDEDDAAAPPLVTRYGASVAQMDKFYTEYRQLFRKEGKGIGMCSRGWSVQSFT